MPSSLCHQHGRKRQLPPCEATDVRGSLFRPCPLSHANALTLVISAIFALSRPTSFLMRPGLCPTFRQTSPQPGTLPRGRRGCLPGQSCGNGGPRLVCQQV